tara:strand:+ start:15948 stop:16151 length:204 start_codon:yes stop_codon:yes gene_type:complete
MIILIKRVKGKKNHTVVFKGKITENDFWVQDGLRTIINVKDLNKNGDYEYLEIKLEHKEVEAIRRVK